MSKYPEELGQLLFIDHCVGGVMYGFTTGPYWLEDGEFVKAGVKKEARDECKES